MKRLFPILALALNGCFACGTGSQVQDVDPDLKVYRPAAPPLDDRHPSAHLDRVTPGSWVRYRRTKDGEETVITLGAVKVEGESVWIEVVEEGDPKRVSLRRVSFDGDVLAARYREIPESGPASEIADQPVSSSGGAPRRPPSSRTEENRKVQAGDKSLDVTVFRNLFRDESLGREHEEEEGWSAAVPPILESQEIGTAVNGLVFRKAPDESIQLLDAGMGYTPLIR